MKSLPIPEIEQLNAMANDSVYQLVSEYIHAPSPALKEYLTIDRRKVTGFLIANPDKCNAYFQRQEKIQAAHDIGKIWEENGKYVYAWMDHGNPRSSKQFESLAEAVTEHVLVSYGMY